MRILMATDGSMHAAAALDFAARMLSPENRKADLMCVVPAPKHPGAGGEARLLRRAQRAVEKVRQVLASAGMVTQPVVKTGSPARVLLKAARDYDVTIVAAASHRRGPMVGLGPVASRLAEHSSGMTLLARNGRLTMDGVRVLAAVDGSEGSIRALDAMTRLIDMSSSEVTLLHVTETPWLPDEATQEGILPEEDDVPDVEAELQREMALEADQILADAREHLPARTAVNTLVYEGLPADEILGEAERGDYDLIVIGATGATDLKHAMLGSVSSKVAWNAPCSVLLVQGAAWE